MEEICSVGGRGGPLTHNNPDKKQAKLDAKTSALWDCVDWTRNEGGGKIYKFRVKPEYNNFRQDASPEDVLKSEGEQRGCKVNHKLFPAIESPPTDLAWLLDPLPSSLGTPWMCLSEVSSFRQLGFEAESKGREFYFWAPNRKALLANWGVFCKTTTDLPPLRIKSAKGIDGDKEFYTAYLTHDVVWSKGSEFFHDLTQHVIPTIYLMLTGGKEVTVEGQKVKNPKYEDEKKYWVDQITLYKERIEKWELVEDDLFKKHVPILHLTLGYTVDYISSLDKYLEVRGGSSDDELSLSFCRLGIPKFMMGAELRKQTNLAQVWEKRAISKLKPDEGILLRMWLSDPKIFGEKPV